MFNVSFQAKGFAPTKPIKLPPYVSGWPQPKGTPPLAKGGPKPIEIPDFAKTLMPKAKPKFPPGVITESLPRVIPIGACTEKVQVPIPKEASTLKQLKFLV